MHTVTLLINNENFNLTILELLPLIRLNTPLRIDTHVKITEALELLKSIPVKKVIEFLTKRLGKVVSESPSKIRPEITAYVPVYESVEEYESRVKELHPIVKSIEFDEEGNPADISRLTADRLEVELAKRLYAYNYSRVDTARAALRQIIANSPNSPPQLKSLIKTRAQKEREQSENQPPRCHFDPEVPSFSGSTSAGKSIVKSVSLRGSEVVFTTGNSTFRDSGVDLAPNFTLNSNGNNPQNANRENIINSILPEIEFREEIVLKKRVRQGQNSESEHSDSQNSESKHSESQQSESEQSESEHLESEHTESEGEGQNPPVMAQNPDFVKLRIPHFTGKITEDIDEHLRRLDVEKAAYNWNDDTAKRVLAYFLGGSARDWYDRKRAALEQLTWIQLKEEVKNRFQPAANRSALKTLGARKQKLSERPMDYFDAMSRLKTRVGNNLADLEFIIHVIDGLLPEPRRIVKQFGNNTLEELEQNIERAEESLGLNDNRTAESGSENLGQEEKLLKKKIDRLETLLTAQVTPLPNVDAENNTLTIDNLVAAISRLATQQGSKEKSQYTSENMAAKTDILCYICKGINHYAKNCLLNVNKTQSQPGSADRYRQMTRSSSKERDNRNEQRDSSNERRNSGGPICQYCSGFGHVASSCRILEGKINGKMQKN